MKSEMKKMPTKKREEIDWLDPRLIEAIEEFDVINFLQENDVDHSEHAKNVGRNYVGIETCPSCGRTNYHSAIHREHKFLTCFVCKCHFSAVRWISYYKRCSFEETVRSLIEDTETELDVVERVQKVLRTKPRGKKEYQKITKDNLFPSRQITARDLRTNRTLKKFFKKRKLFLWHCKRYDLRIGTNKEDRYKIIFPIYTEEILAAHQWRSFTKKKYRLSESAGKYLYDMDSIKKGIILLIVEGFLDYVNIDSYLRAKGLKDKIMVTTGLVKSLSATQIGILNKKRPSKVLFMLDGDSWFDYLKIKNKLLMDADFVVLPKDKDPNAMSWVEFDTLFKQEITNGIE